MAGIPALCGRKIASSLSICINGLPIRCDSFRKYKSCQVQILPFSEEAFERYEQLRMQKLNIRKMDLRIAAITLQFGGVLATGNTRDFCRVPGLRIEDWSV